MHASRYMQQSSEVKLIAATTVTMAQRVDCNISGQHKNKDRAKNTHKPLLERSEN
jgi:hypothetical protein